ncbi:1-deoxy-D-xylulose-5-phosphate reductoisomerase [Candidatus Peregrinibacteria bacterium]|nr:MAG: 1-deoxy-D-xylulose-5-phosphate reductoisomerase [Candidatus Peregrinibacteria bacterium]
MPKPLALFGSTGSIGRQTLEVLAAFPGEFEVVGLTAKSNKSLLEEQGKTLRAQTLLSPSSEQNQALMEQAEFIVNAIPGFAGLDISLAAIRMSTPERPKTLLSANKESLAIAGRFLREEAQKTAARIFPLDSEASAIWQLMHEYGASKISSITLTCSGGPFHGKTRQDLLHVTPAQALAHPTWKMGPKVSIDSATLINKVLEVYEVHHLFDIPLKDIHITIHPQSLVHSMIHTQTGATKMHITQNDMRLFISYALHYPEQPACPWPIERTRKSDLSFEQPDPETFRPLKWLKLHAGNPNFPIILNAMNDLAVARFLDGKLSFLGIYDFIEEGLQRHLWRLPPRNLEELLAFHAEISEGAMALS